MEKCKCFTCTHKDPKERIAYYTGYVDACEVFLRWANRNGIVMGSVSDHGLNGLYAQIDCDYEAALELLDELKG